MTHTTPSRPFDLEAAFPELGPLARPATRLHPRRGTPTTGQSSIGGPLLWPAEEPWPTCTALEYSHAPDRGNPDRAPGPPALTPALQLFVRDVPALPHPKDADVLQVLWCPLDSWHAYMEPTMLWRNSAAVGNRLLEGPRAFGDEVEMELAWVIPRPCTVDPEENVTEYPYADAPQELLERFVEHDDGDGFDNDYYDRMRKGWRIWDLAVVPGCKIGGYPAWTQDPDWPDCPRCQRTMQHLLALQGDEGGRRWIPLEEWETAGYDGGIEQATADTEAAAANRHPLDITFADNGAFNMFYCPECPDMPLASRHDSC